MLTANEKKVLRYLFAHFDSDASINQISRECGLSPNGMHKMFKKFEKENVVLKKKIANVLSYRLHFTSREAKKLMEFTLLTPSSQKRVQYRYDDLRPLEAITSLCILFGSYITEKEKPNDLDILFVLRSSNYTPFQKILEKQRMIIPIKVHDVIQTKSDLKENILKKDPLIRSILEKGIVLWGQEFLVEVISDVAK